MRYYHLLSLALVIICKFSKTTAYGKYSSEDMSQNTAFVSKAAQYEVKPWACDCYNSIEENRTEVSCRCYGKELKTIPDDLSENLHRLTVTFANIRTLGRDFLQPYRRTLRDINLETLPHLRVIEHGIFRGIPNLRSVYISDVPQIKFLHQIFEGVTSKKFLSLRIVRTSLEEIPNLMHIPSENIMHMIDMEGNKISKLPSNIIKLKADQVSLNNNKITVVENYAFNGSEIRKLSLQGNTHLSTLSKYAFYGLKSLRYLDLSDTSIESLPSKGLQELEVLKIENSPSMKTIPSLYDLKSLKEAHLTHHFHCCAFKYPQQHDPIKHAKYENNLRIACQESAGNTHTGKEKRDTGQENMNGENNFQFWNNVFDISGFMSDHHNNPEDSQESLSSNIHHSKDYNKSDHSHLSPLIGETYEEQIMPDVSENEDLGFFHTNSAEISEKHFILCGNLTIVVRHIKCLPEPNALNPCEDIMGSYWLRISVWFVVVLAVLGNMAVIIVVLFGNGEMTVSKFLICNLAIGDLCMGIYLLLIASMDLHSVGAYFNFAFDWQYGLGCKMAGFLTVFASHLSVFTLAIVTLERWFAITYAIHLNRRINTKIAAKTMLGGWVYSIAIAALPLLGISNYSSTSICLPMEIDTVLDKIYLYLMIITNSLAFGLIVFCYTQIYFSLTYETRRTNTKGEMTIAKKMALLVFTDFACWAPIAFFSLTALAGYPLIGVTRSKILLVFFYPLNSCANPYLYAIMTAQYRKDFYTLLSRCNIFSKKSNHYTFSSSLPTNVTIPMPLIPQRNKGTYNKRNNSVNDEYV